MALDLKNLSLESLFERLHGLMVNLVKDVDSIIEDNSEISINTIRQLRDHINYKLGRKEEIHDNENILKVLNLFAEDRAVLEIIREDSEEWIELLDAIRDNLGSGGNLTVRERKEVEDINRLATKIKGLIRKS